MVYGSVCATYTVIYGVRQADSAVTVCPVAQCYGHQVSNPRMMTLSVQCDMTNAPEINVFDVPL